MFIHQIYGMHVKSGIMSNIYPLTKKLVGTYSLVIQLADHVVLLFQGIRFFK
jgi:hypothetical protein